MSGKFWTVAYNAGFGCRKASTGCRNCWARAVCARMAASNNPKSRALVEGAVSPMGPGEDAGKWTGKIVVHLDRAAGRWPMTGTRKMQVIAVNWLSDVGLWNAGEFCALMDGAMQMQNSRYDAGLPLHHMLMLTKRPAKLAALLEHWIHIRLGGSVPDLLVATLWLGATICNEREAGTKWADLMQMPTGFKTWACCEPLLGDVTPPQEMDFRVLSRLYWIVTGCETNGGREMQAWHVRALAKWSQERNIPFLLKNNGCRTAPHTLGGVKHVETPWGPLDDPNWPRRI